ncbi:hypothetical protein NBRGN_057_00130 [Nocardia brasiliensis NBRC 14402]|nr:hypothetical protein NBRGN_057_00130 [Nocardia brasiliensis NBRC 14402]
MLYAEWGCGMPGELYPSGVQLTTTGPAQCRSARLPFPTPPPGPIRTGMCPEPPEMSVTPSRLNQAAAEPDRRFSDAEGGQLRQASPVPDSGKVRHRRGFRPPAVTPLRRTRHSSAHPGHARLPRTSARDAKPRGSWRFFRFGAIAPAPPSGTAPWHLTPENPDPTRKLGNR